MIRLGVKYLIQVIECRLKSAILLQNDLLKRKEYLGGSLVGKQTALT
jgi:hypothetical protein